MKWVVTDIIASAELVDQPSVAIETNITVFISEVIGSSTFLASAGTSWWLIVARLGGLCSGGIDLREFQKTRKI